jgi:hypothetical protein
MKQPHHPQELEDILQKQIRLALADENFLNEFKKQTSQLINNMGEIRNVFINAVPLPDDSKPNDNVDLLGGEHLETSIFNITIPGSTKNNLLNMVDDIEMTLQLLTPKIVDINQKLLNKEKDLFESLKTKFNDEIAKKLEKLTEEKDSNLSSEQEKEIQALRTKLSDAELNFTFTQNQLIEAEKKLAQKANEEKVTANNEALTKAMEKSNKEIKDLQSKIGIDKNEFQ